MPNLRQVIDNFLIGIYIPLLVYISGVLSLGLAGYQTFQQIEYLIQQEKLDDLNAIAAVKIGQITAWREAEERRGEAISYATLLPTEFEQWLHQDAPVFLHKQKIVTMLSGCRQIYGYRVISLLDKHGVIQLSTSDNPTLDIGDIELVRKAIQERQSVLSDIHRDGASGKVSIDLATPLIAHDEHSDRIIGVELLQIDPANFLFPLIQTWPAHSKTAETLLVRQEGDTILFLNEVRHRKGAAMNLRLPVNTPKLPPGMFLRGQLDSLNSVDYRGVPVAATVSRIPGTSWLMVAKIDKAELFAPLVKLKQWSAAVGLVFLTGCGVLVLVWFQSIQASYRLLKAQRDAAVEREFLLKHFEYLTKYANDIIVVANDNGDIIEANDRAVSAYGYSHDELLGKPLWGLRPTADRSAYDKQMAQLRTTGALIFETVACRKEGSTFPVEVSARIIKIAGVEYRQGIIRDITERKVAERRIMRLNDLYAAISQTNTAIVRIKDRATLFVEVCRIAVTYGHFHLVWIGWPDAEQGCIIPVAANGPGVGYLDGLTISLNADQAEGCGPTGAALQQGRAIICQDFATDPLTRPWRDKARTHNLRSSGAWPLTLAGKVVGVLTLYANETNYFDAEMVPLLSSIAQDISFALDNLALEASLRQSEERFRTLTDSAPIIIWMADAQHGKNYSGCAFFNQGWHDFTGLSLVQTRGLRWLQLVHPDDRAQCLRVYQDAFRMAESFKHEYRLLRHDGEYRWMLDSGVCRCSAEGEFLGFIGTCVDITEQKHAEAIHNEIERVGRLNVAMEMTSGLAHELSQPLAAVNNYLTACLHRMKDTNWNRDTIREAVELSLKQTERAGNIINHLKNLIRRQSDGQAQANINTLIRDTIDFLGYEIKQRGILITMELSPVPSVLVNKVEIEQVLINMFKNAIEAMHGVPEPELRITTTSLSNSSKVLVTVVDNGCGIPATTLETIFNPFHTSKKDGLGLGLNICRRLVENHGGRIWADVQRESGAKFNFTLPLGVDHE